MIKVKFEKKTDFFFKFQKLNVGRILFFRMLWTFLRYPVNVSATLTVFNSHLQLDNHMKDN